MRGSGRRVVHALLFVRNGIVPLPLPEALWRCALVADPTEQPVVPGGYLNLK